MQIERIDSPNFNERASGAGVNFLIMHYTEVSRDETVDIFSNQVNPSGSPSVSAHYMIDEDGVVTQFVDEDKRAWHAGQSYWQGITDLNSHSIGIELVNAGASDDFPVFPRAQIEALKELAKDIMVRHHIPPHHVLGHSDIAPGRKIDPGPTFPWSQLAHHGIGIYPDVTPDDAAQALYYFNQASHDAVFKEHLIEMGYDPNVDTRSLKQAFDAHYCPPNPNDDISLSSMIAHLRHLDDLS